jgi:vacuolar-type H+-ATPase subunit D/Vma8
MEKACNNINEETKANKTIAKELEDKADKLKTEYFNQIAENIDSYRKENESLLEATSLEARNEASAQGALDMKEYLGKFVEVFASNFEVHQANINYRKEREGG